MLILLTCASLAILTPAVIPSPAYACDTNRTSGQDTLRAIDTPSPQNNPSLEGISRRPGASPKYRPFGATVHEVPFVQSIDSLLRAESPLKRGFLRELIVPSAPPDQYESASPARSINALLLSESVMTPFERMWLIAKRAAVCRSPVHSWNKDQLDIIATLLWLQEVLK